MLEILRAYLTVNDISWTDIYTDIGAYIQEKHQTDPSSKIVIVNQSVTWYIIEAFYAYMQWTLSLEQFMEVGDETSSYQIYHDIDRLQGVAEAARILATVREHASGENAIVPIVLIDYVAQQFAEARAPEQWQQLQKDCQDLWGKVYVLAKFTYDDPTPYVDSQSSEYLDYNTRD